MAVFVGAPSATGGRRIGSLGWFGGVLGLILLSILFNIISNLEQSGPVSCVPPQCTLPPPRHGPLHATSRYTSSQYGFSVDYSTGNIQPSQTTASSIAWDGQLSDSSEVTWSISGTPANGRSAQQIVQSTQSASYSDAQLAYTIPDASLGYNPGYGAVYDVTVSPASGESEHDRLVVMAATRGKLALVLVGLGPYESAGPGSDPQPNPADTPLVELGDFEENINSITFPGQAGF
jgi:hypothetical protein